MSDRLEIRDMERRGAERVAVDLFVQERDGDRLFVHPATNLSASGIFIESHSYSLRNALERQFIDLEFALPDSPRLISVRGEVVGARRVRGFSHGLAVRFLDLEEADQRRLAEFVSRRLAEGAGEGPVTEAAPTL
jgi:c-di-GMP-binding flagellar brake protein YcgR